MDKKTLPLGRYRHYKGNEYEVLHLAHHSETQECLVIYRCLYGDYSIWARPYDMFVENITVDQTTMPRFCFIETGDNETHD